MATYIIEAIGHVRGGRVNATDDHWGKNHSFIELDPEQFGPEALAGLNTFSHAEVIFLFDKAAPQTVEKSARHPRNREDWPRVGIFAQRGKNRPNRLGITVCKILSVESTRLHLEGLDAIDGSPVIDIKPVMREFLPRGDLRQPEWATELMAAYW